MYDNGRRVTQDSARAVSLYTRAVSPIKKACDDGNASNCSTLGHMYQNGRGVTLDLTRAAALHKKACDNGWAIGCILLGGMYDQGLGVTRDTARAVVLRKKACDIGLKKACDRP